MNDKTSQKKKPGLLFTIAIQLAGLVSLGNWVFIAIFAPMFFDGGDHWRVWALFLGALSAPVLVFIAMVTLWVAYFKQWPRMGTASAIFLLLSLAPMLGAFV